MGHRPNRPATLGGAFADVRPLLARMIDALWTDAVARLLDADRAQVSRWTAGTRPVGAEMGRRIVDLDDVLTRILPVYSRDAASIWLVGSKPLLGGARPIDVLSIEGGAPVIRTINGIAEGASTLIRVPLLYRGLFFLANAAPDEPGRARYIPRRVEDASTTPGVYAVQYLTDAASRAIAEAFGRFPEWWPAVLISKSSLPKR